MKEQTINGVIPKPIFILFAEFLGYDSPLCEIAEKICNGELKESYYVDIINRDADNIFQMMKEEFSLTEIKEYYDQYFPIALESYFNQYKLNCVHDTKEDLPF